MFLVFISTLLVLYLFTFYLIMNVLFAFLLWSQACKEFSADNDVYAYMFYV